MQVQNIQMILKRWVRLLREGITSGKIEILRSSLQTFPHLISWVEDRHTKDIEGELPQKYEKGQDRAIPSTQRPEKSIRLDLKMTLGFHDTEAVGGLIECPSHSMAE